jgi:hypothetical protein
VRRSLRKGSGRRGPRKGIDGSVVKHLGARDVQLEIFVSDGSLIPATMRFDVAGISRAVASVGDLLREGINVVFQSGSGWMERAGRKMPLCRRGTRFFLQAKLRRHHGQ